MGSEGVTMQYCESCGKVIPPGELLYVLFKGADEYTYTKFCKRCGDAMHSLFLANLNSMKEELKK